MSKAAFYISVMGLVIALHLLPDPIVETYGEAPSSLLAVNNGTNEQVTPSLLVSKMKQEIMDRVHRMKQDILHSARKGMDEAKEEARKGADQFHSSLLKEGKDMKGTLFRYANDAESKCVGEGSKIRIMMMDGQGSQGEGCIYGSKDEGGIVRFGSKKKGKYSKFTLRGYENEFFQKLGLDNSGKPLAPPHTPNSTPTQPISTALGNVSDKSNCNLDTCSKCTLQQVPWCDDTAAKEGKCCATRGGKLLVKVPPHSYHRTENKHCLPGSGDGRSNIGSYQAIGLQDAKSQCSANPECKGFTIKRGVGILLKNMISGFSSKNTAYECYRKETEAEAGKRLQEDDKKKKKMLAEVEEMKAAKEEKKKKMLAEVEEMKRKKKLEEEEKKKKILAEVEEMKRKKLEEEANHAEQERKKEEKRKMLAAVKAAKHAEEEKKKKILAELEEMKAAKEAKEKKAAADRAHILATVKATEEEKKKKILAELEKMKRNMNVSHNWHI